jgi:hypothetical protein
MRKLPSPKAVPWLLLLEGVTTARHHWQRLTPEERAHLQRLVVASRGRPGHLGTRDRLELRRLAKKLDLPGLGRDLVPLAGRARRRGRRP